MKNKKGFTLIESIITFAILAIAGLMLMSLTSNVINLMSDSSFIKNETDRKYADIQVGWNVETKEDDEVTLVLNDGQPPIITKVKGMKSINDINDKFDFQLSKVVADSEWIDEAKGELVDATFVIIKDITKYKLMDGDTIILDKNDYLKVDKNNNVNEGIMVPKSLDTSIGNEMVTIVQKPIEGYIFNSPTFNQFNELVGQNGNLLEEKFERKYLEALRVGFKNQLENNIPIPIEWVAVDPNEKIVYGIIIPVTPENPDPIDPDNPGGGEEEKPKDIFITIDNGSGDRTFDTETGNIKSEIKGGPHIYNFYIDGALVRQYEGGYVMKNFDKIIEELKIEYPKMKILNIVFIDKK